MSLKIFLTIFIFILTGASFLVSEAASLNGNEAGKKFASEKNEKEIEKMASEIDPKVVPPFQGEDVEAKKYYESGVKIEEEAKEVSKKDENAQYIKESQAKRPAFNIDPENDPLFKRYDEIKQKGHALTEEYKGCQDLPVGQEDKTQYKVETCLELGSREKEIYQCDRILEVRCHNPEAGETGFFQLDDFTVSGPAMEKRRDGTNFLFGSDFINRSGPCKSYVNTITFNIRNLNEILEFMVAYVTYDDWVKIELNGQVAFSENITSCERNQVWGKPSIDLKPFLRIGANTLTITNTVQGGGRVLVNLKATKRYPCQEREEIYNSCPNGKTPSPANLQNRECKDGPGTKIIRGLSIFRPCWRWQDTYSELSAPIYTRENLCLELVNRGCGQSKAECLEEEDTFCKKRVLSFNCPHLVAAKTVKLCGEELTCPDGGCTEEYQSYQPATEDFKKAGTSLEVAKAILQEANQGQLNLFQGIPKKCKKNALGFKDCCKDSGWGMDLNLAECSSEEKELGISRERKSAHFVGEYKSGGVVDTRKYSVYCTYSSKLARIIVEQGKNQQQKGFGDARSPDCSGFSFEELETLDFNQMDFSEFYDDVMKKAANSPLPNIEETIKKIRESLAKKFPAKKEGKP